MKLEQAFKLVLGSSLVYAIVAACGSGSGGHAGKDGGPVADAMADVNQSGSRLKAQYYKGADGSRSFAGMYDTQTKHTCAFVTASDATTRCLPSGPDVLASTTYFSDKGCTMPILNVPKDCTTAPAYIGTLETTCGGATKFHVFPAGSAFTPGTDVYVFLGTGTTAACVPVATTKTHGDWVSAMTEAAASTFEAGTLTTE